MIPPPVLAHMQSLGHQIFTNGDYNLNLFGITAILRLIFIHPDNCLASRVNPRLCCRCHLFNSQLWHARLDRRRHPAKRFYLSNMLARFLDKLLG